MAEDRFFRFMGIGNDFVLPAEAVPLGSDDFDDFVERLLAGDWPSGLRILDADQGWIV